MSGLYLAGVCFALLLLALVWTLVEWHEQIQDRRRQRLVERNFWRTGMR